LTEALPTDATSPPGWRWSKRLALVALVAFLVVQTVIPVVLLSRPHEHAQRYAWQMFAYSTSGRFVAVTPTGEEIVDLDLILARPRADMNLVAVVPGHVCGTRPEVIRVTWDGGQLEC
jgi:hypothetical protein